ncbi:GntR family transcriptional regulator [Achromobacter insolitus]|uniref:GntR family transcriptional regulator n=1 Tax=Achromobacter insolitus TaxID=217204 RepID=UPI002FE0A717
MSLRSSATTRAKPAIRGKTVADTASTSTSTAATATAAGSQEGDMERRICEAVYESVMSQRLTPGTKLPEAAICELFGVPRSVARKALQRLAHEHVVELHHNRGAVVAEPTPEDTRQIFQARRALEAALVPLAAARASKTDYASLRKQLREEHALLHRVGQPAWARQASAFHLRLGELSGNAILQGYLAELVSRCSLIVALYEPPGNAACEHGEHVQIVDLMESGAVAEAVKINDIHLVDLERRISLERPQPAQTLAQMLGLA